MKKYQGIICTLASATLFGFAPILAMLAYAGGANGTTMVFLRAVISLPLLLLLLRWMKVPLRLSKQEFLHLLPIGVFGMATTSILLYASYSYIGAGLSTTLHYSYPVFIIVCYAVFFRQKTGWMKWLALIASVGGVLMMMKPGQSGNLVGILLAVLSGATYAYYMIALDRTGLKDMHYFKLTFYICTIVGVSSFLFGAVTDTLRFPQTALSWMYTILLSVLVSVAAFGLLHRGIALAGPTTVAILSTAEPITSVIFGALILHEQLSVLNIIGCVFILASVLLVAYSDRKKHDEDNPVAQDIPHA